MSLWDTSPWSNFYDPRWELICRNKWHPEIFEITTLLEIAVGTHFHAWHGTRTFSVFLPANGEASWSLLPSSVSLPYSQAAQCNHKTYIPVSSMWEIKSEEAKKWSALTLIIVTTSFHLPYPVSTDLKIKWDSVLTNPIGKDGMQGW